MIKKIKEFLAKHHFSEKIEKTRIYLKEHATIIIGGAFLTYLITPTIRVYWHYTDKMEKSEQDKKELEARYDTCHSQQVLLETQLFQIKQTYDLTKILNTKSTESQTIPPLKPPTNQIEPISNYSVKSSEEPDIQKMLKQEKDQAVVIDITNNRIFGSYFDSSISKINSFELIYNNKEQLKLGIENKAEQLAGLKNKGHVYLIGEIPWKASIMLSKDVRNLEKEQISMNFINLNNESYLHDKNITNEFCKNESVEKICNDSQELTNALDITKTLILGLNFENKKLVFLKSINAYNFVVKN